jgi:UDP-N-acetylglucosamine 2-epimerase (non-hydrolysing)
MDEIMLIVGTRPEIIKMAPVVRALQAKSIQFVFVHCGQHYDYNMSQQFIEELELPKPDYGFEVRVSSPSLQTSRIMAMIGRVVNEVKPKLVLIEGDTNGVLASALAALKLNAPVGHVEAGLRSFDLRMPEEHNRRLVDHISTYLFAPTENARKNLEKENVWGKTFVTGNTVIDAVMQHLPLAEKKSTILEKMKFDEFALVTAHRAENVDDPVVLQNFVEAFIEAPIPVVYPVHPRTQKRLRQYKMWKKLVSSKNVQILPPLGYFDFLLLMKECKLIITDSGGIQEEATAPLLRKPVLVTRLSTERPEAVEFGFAEIVGVHKKDILESMEKALGENSSLPHISPFGDGDAAKRIVSIIAEEL